MRGPYGCFWREVAASAPGCDACQRATRAMDNDTVCVCVLPCAGARKLVGASANQPRGHQLLRTQLSPEQRTSLFRRGLQFMSRPDPQLASIGEPQTTGRAVFDVRAD
jgi:hypothetical protein